MKLAISASRLAGTAALVATLLSATASAQAPNAAQLQSLLENGQVNTAVTTLESTLGDNPFDPVQLNNLAVARSRNGDVYAALQLLDRAARLAPEQPVIADNRNKLRTWIATKIGANKQQMEAVPVYEVPSQLPDPPALWER